MGCLFGSIASMPDVIRGSPTTGDRILEWDARVEREATEQYRRVKALDAVDEGMANNVHGRAIR